MRPHRRPGPLRHLLLGAGVEELDAVQAVLDDLPETAYGQVWIEAPGATSSPVLRYPGRVVVHLLPATIAPGERAARALRAGCAEWCLEPSRPDRELTVWAGRSVRPHLVGVGVVEPG